MGDVHVRAFYARTDRFHGTVYGVSTPYHAEFIADLKVEIHPRHRAWEPELRLWIVEACELDTLERLLKDHFGPIRRCTKCPGCFAWAKLEAKASVRGYGPAASAPPPPPPPPRSQYRPPPRDEYRAPPPPPRRSAEPTLQEACAALELSLPVEKPAVQRSFAHLALKHHPDHGGDQAKMILLIAARAVLLAYLEQSQRRASW